MAIFQNFVKLKIRKKRREHFFLHKTPFLYIISLIEGVSYFDVFGRRDLLVSIFLADGDREGQALALRGKGGVISP